MAKASRQQSLFDKQDAVQPSPNSSPPTRFENEPVANEQSPAGESKPVSESLRRFEATHLQE